MRKEEIKINVKKEVNKWLDFQSRTGNNWKISEKAMDFIVEVIENIQEDPSSTWQQANFNSEALQELAISLVPNALNDIIGNGKIRRYEKKLDGIITTWEIWHSLSGTISKWCFVPKDV